MLNSGAVEVGGSLKHVCRVWFATVLSPQPDTFERNDWEVLVSPERRDGDHGL